MLIQDGLQSYQFGKMIPSLHIDILTLSICKTNIEL